MTNKLRATTAIGMPYHGLAVNGTATFPGDITVQVAGGNSNTLPIRNHTIPTFTRSPEQEASDIAKNLSWRDYALITGPDKYVNGSENFLGFDSWIYCDDNGRPWIIQVQKQGTNGSGTATFEVWRRDLFGLFRDSRALPAITYELLTTFDLIIDIPPDYDGTTTAETIAGDCDISNACSIVPSLAGDLCYIHILSVYSDVHFSTVARYENQEFALAGIAQISLFGAGDIDNNGVGISASVDSVLTYSQLVIYENQGSWQTGTPRGQLSPPWEECNRIRTDPPPLEAIGPPSGPGQTYAQVFEDQPTYRGQTNTWIRYTGQRSSAIVYRSITGDVIYDFDDYTAFVEIDEMNNGDWIATQNWISEENPDYNPDDPTSEEFRWALDGPIEYNTTGWSKSTRYDFPTTTERYLVDAGNNIVNEYWTQTAPRTESYTNWDFAGNGCSAFPSNPPVPPTENFPGSFDSSLGELSNGMNPGSISLVMQANIFSRLVINDIFHYRLDNSFVAEFKYDFFSEPLAGFKLEPLRLATSNDLPGPYTPSFSFQPVSDEIIYDFSGDSYQYF